MAPLRVRLLVRDAMFGFGFGLVLALAVGLVTSATSGDAPVIQGP